MVAAHQAAALRHRLRILPPRFAGGFPGAECHLCARPAPAVTPWGPEEPLSTGNPTPCSLRTEKGSAFITVKLGASMVSSVLSFLFSHLSEHLFPSVLL